MPKNFKIKTSFAKHHYRCHNARLSIAENIDQMALFPHKSERNNDSKRQLRRFHDRQIEIIKDLLKQILSIEIR
jgi:hypothetical protein